MWMCTHTKWNPPVPAQTFARRERSLPGTRICRPGRDSVLPGKLDSANGTPLMRETHFPGISFPRVCLREPGTGRMQRLEQIVKESRHPAGRRGKAWLSRSQRNARSRSLKGHSSVVAHDLLNLCRSVPVCGTRGCTADRLATLSHVSVLILPQRQLPSPEVISHFLLFQRTLRHTRFPLRLRATALVCFLQPFLSAAGHLRVLHRALCESVVGVESQRQ